MVCSFNAVGNFVKIDGILSAEKYNHFDPLCSTIWKVSA